MTDLRQELERMLVLDSREHPFDDYCHGTDSAARLADALNARLQPAIKLLLDCQALIEAHAPEWETCEHDYEPNTAMDFFRCDKCGARPRDVEALTQLRALVDRERGSGGD